MKILKLKSGAKIKLDNDDYQRVVDYGGWYIDGRGYAISDKIINGERVIADLHRFIHPPAKGFVVDHVNQDKLDNRRGNLRDATKSINALNCKVHSHNKSGYKGVCWSKSAKKWRATINIGGKQFHLGFFIDIEDAHKVYQSRLKEVLA